MLSESHIIEQLQAAFSQTDPTIIGIGDDAACIPIDAQRSWVISKDLFIEDIHFRRRYFTPEQIAHKSLHVNLSDIAAMGAQPRFVLMGLALPRGESQDWVNAFLKQFTQSCQQANVLLIGGDTTESKAGIYISITIIGEARTQQIKYRRTAQVDDNICIVGTTGEAHAGLLALEQDTSHLEAVKHRFLQPQAKVQEGLWLAGQPGVTAMMDLSDGLYIDLTRLCESSNKGAVIELSELHASPELVEACNQLKIEPQQAMLAGGEDYGLLITVSSQAFTELQAQFKAKFGYSLTSIGRIINQNGVQFQDKGQPVALNIQAFSHFGESYL